MVPLTHAIPVGMVQALRDMAEASIVAAMVITCLVLMLAGGKGR